MNYDDIYKKNCNSDYEIFGIIKKDKTLEAIKYKDLLAKTEEIAKKMIEYGINQNDYIAIFASDSPQWVMYFLAIFKLNANAVLIEKNLENEELDRIIGKYNLKAICTERKLVEKVQNRAYLIFDIYDENNIMVNENMKMESKENYPEATCTIFSSGTTSEKVGITHKTSNLYEMITHTNERYKLTPNERFITVVPNTHIYGLSMNIVQPTILTAKMCFLEELNSDVLQYAIKEINPTFFAGVPKLYEILKSQIERKIDKKIYYDLIKLCCLIRRGLKINIGKKIFKKIYDGLGKDVTFVSAGASLKKDTKDFYWGVGIKMIEFYGSTETGVPVTGTPNQNRYTLGVGTVLYPCEIKIEKDTRELLVRNEYSMLKDLNEKPIDKTEEWMRTGDIARKDILNNIHIVGRIKENIVLENGEKIAPLDVEYYYRKIEGVKEFVVCGVPAEKDSPYDEICMFVVKENNALEEEIKNSIREISKKVTPNMRVKKIFFIEDIPKTGIGKPKRYMLKKIC